MKIHSNIGVGKEGVINVYRCPNFPKIIYYNIDVTKNKAKC
jgi:hypothetical protein